MFLKFIQLLVDITCKLAETPLVTGQTSAPFVTSWLRLDIDEQKKHRNVFWAITLTPIMVIFF